ncbi:hypothetical protein BDN72DRAFT_965999 [Pluteus cervinus]|uniref:Uncharacterized protein n=1 Tax=Pluteus cervinus TaxID=181527 RepID=A0ACD3A1S1_9AGAR|nr:hypothetical protein BDN72DRAFT_965999 [Pluteus cervinus]
MDISGLTKAEAFAKLDSEMAHLEKRLLVLRNLRNTLPPISSLPNEILAQIFLICHNLDIEPDSNGIVHWKSKTQGQTRLVLSWISHCWRITAISYPDLWTFVPNGSTEYLQACLFRSKGLDIAVILDGPQQRHIQQCFREMPRIRNLHADFSGTPDSECIDPDGAWDLHAPPLVSLSIKDMDLGEAKGDDPLFSAVHPQLRHSIIDNSDFMWDSPFVSAPTLTTLHVINPDERISVEDLVAKLQTMASLVDCKFVSCLSEPVQPHDQIHQQLVLPNLRTLTLQQKPMTSVFALLSHLDTPNSSVYIGSDPEGLASEYFDNTFQLFHEYWYKSRYRKPDDKEPLYLSIDCHPPPTFILTVSTPVVEGTSCRFTMTIRSRIGGSIYNVPPSLSLLGPNFRTVSLNGVSSSIISFVAKFTDPRLLRITNFRGLEESGDQQQRFGGEETGLECCFSHLEELEVDGRRYNSFEELYSSKSQ